MSVKALELSNIEIESSLSQVHLANQIFILVNFPSFFTIVNNERDKMLKI